MNKEINEKEETKVTKQEEYNQILELFGEKAEEIEKEKMEQSKENEEQTQENETEITKNTESIDE